MDFAPLCGGGEIKLGTTPKALTPFGGLASFIAWLRDAGFEQAAAAAMPWSYRFAQRDPTGADFHGVFVCEHHRRVALCALRLAAL